MEQSSEVASQRLPVWTNVYEKVNLRRASGLWFAAFCGLLGSIQTHIGLAPNLAALNPPKYDDISALCGLGKLNYFLA